MKATETYYENKISKLDASIQRVRKLHNEYVDCDCGCDIPICEECKSDYPCPTIKALDGE